MRKFSGALAMLYLLTKMVLHGCKHFSRLTKLINLLKETKNLYSENCKKSKTQTDKEIYHAHGLEESILSKMFILPEAIYRFNAIPIQLPMAFFHRTRTKYLIVYMETQNTPSSQNSFEEEKWSWRKQAP